MTVGDLHRLMLRFPMDAHVGRLQPDGSIELLTPEKLVIAHEGQQCKATEKLGQQEMFGEKRTR